MSPVKQCLPVNIEGSTIALRGTGLLNHLKSHNLSVIRRKLDKSNTLHYFTAEQFVDDVLLMFKNCATFNYPDSEVAQAGRNLEVFFLSKLREFFPEQTFPSASQDTTDRARLRWLGRKRKENCRKKKYVFRGKKYYL